ncbi:DUF4031 domain-containing protein [Microvirga arsenatis]|uniref:DUF4031 domain-containing protein n=1 Tax=Microvirga arsenatis TaxID=2692265 RepID=A0ABW9YXP1_9HYPH|nr:DUF4031 domain-containing protein [Microvirga arsenatis]NBJ13236.1 DUF4031 domain-containing protein [Microvirga arsenatis]NBJ25126.1 DUF4031 domain-containing protein [Microvirga arsenatis]
MTVYVDSLRLPYRGMLMCHMFADSLDELHAMADRIGVARKHFQKPPKASWHHYDICLTKRAKAVRCGAVSTDRYGASEFMARKKGDQATLERIRRLRERKSAARRQPEPATTDLFSRGAAHA